MSTQNDFIFTDCGSLWTCHPQHEAATAHLQEHVPTGNWLGRGLAVEPRFLQDFVDQLQEAGFICGIDKGANDV